MSPNTEKKAGPGKASGPAFLLIGKLCKTHGIHGEMDLQVYTDFPERLRHGKKLYLGEEKTPIILDTLRPKNKLMLVAFEGINSSEEARLPIRKFMSRPPMFRRYPRVFFTTMN
jgi:ribosomal 30S subunit maturation factor RimM